MDSVRNLTNSLPSSGFNYQVGSLNFSTSYLQAGAVVFLLFILVLTLAQVRRHFVDWSLKGALFGLFFGFILALILEGFLLVGGKTAITEVIGWKSAPKPILAVLDIGRDKLINVLGINTEIPSSKAKNRLNPQEIIESFTSLSSSEAEEVKEIICKP